MYESRFDNAFTLLDASGIYGTAKGTIKVIRGLATKELGRREIQDITKQMAQSSIGAQKAPVQVVAHAAAGDLGEAAVQQSTANAMGVAAGTANLEEMALNKQMSFLKAQQDNMRATFGNYGQEVVNRIQEKSGIFYDNLRTAILNRMRVERISEVVATQDGIRAVKEEFLNDYPGLRNSIIDMNSFLHLEGLTDVGGARHIAVSLGKAAEGLEVRRPTPGKAVWSNKDVDIPIEVLDEAPHKGPDGRYYQKVTHDGKESYVPVDEITGVAMHDVVISV